MAHLVPDQIRSTKDCSDSVTAARNPTSRTSNDDDNPLRLAESVEESVGRWAGAGAGGRAGGRRSLLTYVDFPDR